MGFRTTVALAGFALCAYAGSAAAESDPMIDGARQCTQHFPVQERQQAIPTHLLAAISSTESGRWHKGLGLALPWPWTVNVEGKGHYYNSKAEAIANTQAFLRAGARSIDVGCMQVNLKHHPKAFGSLDEAFDPGANVAYAAKFLRTNYNDLGDWIKATAAYHSRTDYYGRKYLARIEKSWTSIVTKVAQARANQGLAPQEEASPDFTPAAPVGTPMRRIDSAHNVRSIMVSESANRRAAEVIVVRAAPAEPVTAPLAVADASASGEMTVKSSRGVQVSAPRVDSAPAQADTAAKAAPSQPKFVFAN